MTLELRKYQTKMMRRVIKQLGKRDSVMVQLPTGTGKSVVAVSLLALFQSENRPSAWLTHRQELQRQSGGHIREAKMQPVHMGNLKPRDRRWYRGSGAVNIISPQLRSYPEFTAKPGLLIVDEAHHSAATTWSRLIDSWLQEGGQVIGFTATPWRMSDKQGFTDWYDKLLIGPSISWFQDRGWLAAPRVIIPQDGRVDITNAEINRASGDYSVQWMESEIVMLLAQKPVVTLWAKHTRRMLDRRTLWFLPSVHSAEKLVSLLPNAALLTGETPGFVRRKLLRDFEHKKLTNLVSVDILSEGIDTPTVPVIASLRPTKSLAVFLQQCGRGSRPKSKSGGSYLLLDFSANTDRHGMPDSDRVWSLRARSDEPGYIGGDPPEARCYGKMCEDLRIHPSHRQCYFCKKDQYFICPECQTSRRWTSFAKHGTMCKHCYAARLSARYDNRELHDLFKSFD